jgi:ribokinase
MGHGSSSSAASDASGLTVLQDLEAEGIDAGSLHRSGTAATGAAFITVDAAGQNTIVVASGANADLDPIMTGAAIDALRPIPADVCLLSFELPLETVVHAARLIRDAGAQLLVNPAPALPLPEALLACRPILTPNETEATALTGEADVVAAIRRLAVMAGTWAVATVGGAGAILADQAGITAIPGWDVPVVDTTGAGDTFSGVLAAALAHGEPPRTAVMRANAAAAVSVRALGARAGMPSRAELDAFLAARMVAGGVSMSSPE